MNNAEETSNMDDIEDIAESSLGGDDFEENPKRRIKATPMSRRRICIILSLTVTLLLSAIVPFLVYRNILQGFYYAQLDMIYPTHGEIVTELHCPVKPNKTLEGNESKEQPPAFKLPLKTRGRDIIDSSGERVKLISINWYGGSDKDFVPGGLDVRHRSDIAKTIKDLGFNSVRLPYSDEMVLTNPDVPAKHWYRNADLALLASSKREGQNSNNSNFQKDDGPHDDDQHTTRGPHHDNDGEQGQPPPTISKNSTITVKALDIFEAVVTALTNEGIAVIINNHITQARWCCDANLCDATWSNEYLGKVCRIVQTEEQWMQNWEKVMEPYIDNPLVIGVDLRNENRSPIGKMLWPTWAEAAEKAAIRLHKLQPNWLIVVEGVASSNYLQGVRSRPVVLPIPDRVVYSAHVYGWSGWGSLLKGPYWSRDYASFAYDMYDNWGYLLEENIAPVWVGEFGAPGEPNTGDLNYWTNLMKFLEDVDPDWGYWAINPRKAGGNSTDTYALVTDDWVTPYCDYRMYDLQRLGLRPYNTSTLPDSNTTTPTTTTALPAKTSVALLPGIVDQAPLGF